MLQHIVQEPYDFVLDNYFNSVLKCISMFFKKVQCFLLFLFIHEQFIAKSDNFQLFLMATLVFE